MSGILFGVCGCCRGSLTGEAQVAYGYAPYFMGWTDWNTTTYQYMTELSRPVPDFIYLTRHTDYVDLDTGAIVNTLDETWSPTGIYSSVGVGGCPPPAKA